MSTHMVAFGASGATPKQRMVQMAAGLGMFPREDLEKMIALIAAVGLYWTVTRLV